MASDALTEGLRETLTVFGTSGGPGEPMTADEVTERLDVSRRRTCDRLERLADRGLLATKEIGADGRVWWRPSVGRTDNSRLDDGTSRDDANGTRDETDSRQYEQRLDEEKAFVESVLDSQLDLVYAFDTDCEVRQWNDRFREVIGYADDEIRNMHPIEFVADEAVERVTATIQRVIEAGESVTFELPLVTAADAEILYEFSAAPITGDEGEIVGVTGVGRDITEQKAREQHLQRQRNTFARELDDIFKRIDDAFCAVDDQFRFTYVNERAQELLGRSRKELLGESIWELFPETGETSVRERFARALETGEPTSYEFYSETLAFWGEANVYPSENGLSVYFRDVTERKERERELEQYETVMNRASDVIVTIDTDSVIRDVNPAVTEMFGYNPDELTGDSLTTLMPDRLADAHREAVQQYLREGDRTLNWEYVELTGVRADGTEFPLAVSFSEHQHGEVHYFTGIIRDITERKEYERKLEYQIRQQEVVTDLGQRALEDRDVDALMAEAAELVARTLDNDYCKVLDLDADAEDLLLRQGVGWNAGIVGEATVSSVEDDSQVAYTLASRDPVVVEDLETETRFSGPELLTSHDVRSGISTIIGSPDSPWGILGTHDTASKEFSEQDVNFVQAVANILATAINRHDDEQELVRQREQLVALNNLHEVVRGITAATIEQSTREEIEETVCERLADSDSYLFAWIGEVDAASQRVTLRTEAGVEGYLDETSISVDSDDERGEGPTGKAFRTGEVQTVQDTHTDSTYETWRDQSETYGFRSSAAVPIVHEDTTYGVLNVHAERPRVRGSGTCGN